MTAIENESIENLLHEFHPQKTNDFADVTWITDIADTNALNYNAGIINFNTVAQRMSLIDYRHGFMVIPLSISGKDNPLTAPAGSPPNVALKNGVAQLVYGMNIKCNNIKIQETTNLNQYNAILQMINDSVDWQLSNGSQYQISKDTTDKNDASEFVTPIVANNLVRNDKYNDGFYKRIQFLKPYYKQVPVLTPAQIAAGGVQAPPAGWWSFKCIIPLRLVSGFFSELHTPLYNVYFHLNVGITSMVQNSGTNAPVMADSNALVAPNGSPHYQLSIGNQLLAYPGLDSTCYLYLPELKLRGDAQKKFMALIDSGFSKDVTFYDIKSFLNPNATTLNNTSLKCLLTPGIIAPTRIFTTLYPAGSSNDNASPSPCQSKGTLTRSNILINNKRQYPRDLQFDFEHWDLLKKEFYNGGLDNQTGSLISYQDFSSPNGNHRYYVHNIQRFVKALATPDQPISIQFDGAVTTDSVGYDVWHHVEFEVTVSINMSTSTITTYNTA